MMKRPKTIALDVYLLEEELIEDKQRKSQKISCSV